LRGALRPLRFRFDRSPRCVAGARGTVSWVRGCGWASDATHSRVAVAGQLPPGRRGYAAAGWVGGLVAVQSCAGRPPVGIWVAVTRPAACRAWRAVVDLAGGLVVVECLADLAAGQPAGVLLEGGVDLFGERIAGRAGQRPRGGSGGVVLECERGLEVRGGDLALAVGEGVEEREPDDVRLGAGGDLRDDPVLRFGRESPVGVVPQLARVGVEPNLAGCACLS
jgi:hypothetical protein